MGRRAGGVPSCVDTFVRRSFATACGSHFLRIRRRRPAPVRGNRHVDGLDAVLELGHRSTRSPSSIAPSRKSDAHEDVRLAPPHRA